MARTVEIVSSIGAAAFWFWASLVRVPPFPDVGFGSSSKVFEPVHAALRKASCLNAIAAACAAVAALTSVFA